MWECSYAFNFLRRILIFFLVFSISNQLSVSFLLKYNARSCVAHVWCFIHLDLCFTFRSRCPWIDFIHGYWVSDLTVNRLTDLPLTTALNLQFKLLCISNKHKDLLVTCARACVQLHIASDRLWCRSEMEKYHISCAFEAISTPSACPSYYFNPPSVMFRKWGSCNI